jgi:hypothetical protein
MAITESEISLERLPQRPWGEPLRIARKSLGLSLVNVKDITHGEITDSALSALEGLAEMPTARTKRRRAARAMVLYGYDPEELGLSLDDLGSVTKERLRELLIEGVGRLGIEPRTYGLKARCSAS